MSLTDSVYTNPDALRAKYVNPKNVLQNIDEQASTGQEVPQSVLNGQNAGTGVGSGPITGGGGGFGGGTIGCPALTEYVLARSSTGGVESRQVNSLQIFKDYLYNPLSNTFHQIIAAEVILTECYELATASGVAQIVSLTHPVIQSVSDATGTSVIELLADYSKNWRAVEWHKTITAETDIRSIIHAGVRQCLRLSLADGFIYASGTRPDEMLLGHNNKPSGGDPGNPGGGRHGIEEFNY